MGKADGGQTAKGPRGTDPESGTMRGSRQRKQVVVSAAGLVVILGVGAVVLQQAHDDGNQAAQDGAAPAASSSTPSAADRIGLSPAPLGSHLPTASPTAKAEIVSPRATPRSLTTSGIITSLRAQASRAAKDGSQVRRPRTGPFRVADQDLHTTESGSLAEMGWTMKVVSARQDLTGQRELLYVADPGEVVGDARCTQKVTASPDVPPQVRPTLLLCWRLSAKKSVYTVLIDMKKRPSRQKSVAAIDEAWSNLD